MGFHEGTQEILAGAHYCTSFIARVVDTLYRKFRRCTIYLCSIL